MNETEALLVVERGPIPTLQVALESEQLTVGRSSGNDLVLVDPEVSRRHIRITRRADGFAVEDTGSTNGTFVNGQRITHLTLLQDGDTIDLGDTVRLRYVVIRHPPDDGIPAEPTGMTDKPTQAYSPVTHPSVEPVARPPAPAPQPNPRPVPPPPVAPVPAPAAAYAPPPSYDTEPQRRGRWLWVGCGLLAALFLVCAGTFLVLDAYDQGRLLYCGPLSSLFELILGPFGFAPICP